MNIRMKYLVSGCALLIAALSACSDGDTMDGRFPVKTGDAVRFAASQRPGFRTIYDDENIFQINWENQDNIKIYSNKAYNGVSNADYTVTPIETNGEGTNKLYNEGTIAASGENELMWADNNEHKFIGVYPNNVAGISVDMVNNTVTFPINRDQRCEAITVSGNEYYAKKYSDYTYYAKPDMKNAYLVAYNALTPEQAAANNGDVFLNFKPVMTAIEVVVKGATNENTDVQVTGISVRREFPSNNTTSKSTFTWNAQTEQMVYSTEGGSSSTTRTIVETNMVSLNEAVTLHGPETIVFTVFLPPFEVNDKFPMKVRVHATGATEVVTKDITDEILASNKRRVTMPNFPEVDPGNNWITPLDDNIYVSQMSIPGTHDAATGDGTTFSLGKTQELTLDQQFELGIRAFDLRPAVNSDNDIIITHGAVATKFAWDQVMERFKYYLKTNPGEFIIVFMRHEDEYRTGLINNKNTTENWQTLMKQKLETIKNTTNPTTNQGYTVDFKPDLTIAEMRGKILFLCRDWTPYDANKTTICGGYTGWSHNVQGAEVSIYSDSGRGTINLQDCYAPSEDGTSNILNTTQYPTLKWNGIKALLDKSMKFHTDSEMVNRWSLNHSSGYVNWVSTDNGYRENAANNNIKLYNYITSTNWVGSTGIILMDYVGARTSGNYTVYGDLLPQTIINNNYKYRMKRKGE